jgi:uncharacterized membrane protein
MDNALASATTSASGPQVARLLVVIVLLGFGFPLVRKLRRTASERRKRRWIEEGLMDPPAVDPEASSPSD